ncbi:MAG: hypothetical protein DHS20C10_13060 [marine bacterium B5-7]|nr:MAG: hypothetical protein DHS20C10_13060 [marine bacterium B5-7]
MVILDTCAVIELCKEAPTFTGITEKRIAQSAAILSISFAEIACKVTAKKLQMAITPAALHRRIVQTEAIQLLDIGAEDWLRAVDLDWPTHRDLADRLIVSYAQHHQYAIVSSDRAMKQFYGDVIW